MLTIQMEKVKTALRNNDLGAAADLLVGMLSSDDLFAYWLAASQGSERIPHILRYVNRITFDPDISTASVNLLEGVVRLSPVFFLNHILGPEDILFVLLHERNHLILRKLWPETACQEYPPVLFNWAEDVYINAMARSQVLSTLPERYYADNDPFRLLLTGKHSAVDWDALTYKVEGENLFKNAHASMYARSPEFLAAIHEPPMISRDYSGYHQWMDLVLEWWTAKGKDNGTNEEIIEIVSAIPSIVFNNDPGPIVAVQAGRILDGLEGQPIPDISPDDPVVRMILSTCEIPEIRIKVDVFDITRIRRVDIMLGGIISQRALVCFHEGYSITVPQTVTRKDAFSLAMGVTPVLWQRYFGMEKPVVDLYVDVSGSMSRFYMYIPFIYKSILHNVGRIFQFSEKVVRVDHSERCLFTTGGTSFDKVASHMLSEEVRWAILLSDGISSMNTDLMKALARQMEHLVYLKVAPNGYCNWERIARDVVLLQGGGA